MIVARRVAASLKSLGISRVYGLPGEDHMTLLDALAQEGIDYFAAVNESSAVIMAATEAQVSGLPGVVVVSLAPGLSNALNGLAHAALEFSPLLVISGNFPAHRESVVVRQGYDLRKMVDPFVKWSCRTAENSDVVVNLCRALDIASAHRPGPVFFELADEIAKSEERIQPDLTAIDVLLAEWRDRGQSRLVGSLPTPATVESLQARLTAAKRPALIIGGRRSDVDRAQAERFSTAFRAPVFTSSGQKGLLDSSSVYYAGTFLNGSLESDLLDQADLIVWINPEAYDYYNKKWPYSAYTVAITPAAFDEWLYTFSERVVADPGGTLDALTDAASEPASQWTGEDVVSYRRHVTSSLLDGTFASMTVPAAVEAALASSPANVRITADAGFSKPIVAMLSEPQRRGDYFASNGLSTMGYSIPAGIAAARGSSEPVLSFLGDGSMLMRATELVYAQELAGRLVVVTIVDKALSQIEIKQERLGLRTVGVTLPEISCALLAQSIGIKGVDVDNVEDLRSAVEAAWQSEIPTLIGAHISPESSRTFFEVVRG